MRQTRLPDYHFLFIAPDLGAEWLFDASREYWNRFRPTIISAFDLVSYVPEDASAAVTVVARRDTIDTIGVSLAQIAPRAFYDPIVHDTFEAMQSALDQRAILNQPFGVPLEPTAPPGGEIQLAPGSVLDAPPTRPPGGFITQTPTPPFAPPTPAPPDSVAPPAPTVQPTPGSLIGG
jgi:hypothetical protein